MRSHTHASPPSWEATSDSSLSRAGSASALSIGTTPAAAVAESGSPRKGEQQATASIGASTADFDMGRY